LPDGGTDDTIHIITGTNPGDIPASAVRIVGRAQYFDPDSVQIIVDGFGTIHLNSQLLDPKVEWLQIGDSDPIRLTGGLPMTGSAVSEAIKGTKFNDTINGKGGNDNLIGRLGNDTYIIDNAGVVITENLNEGTDTVKSSISLTLPLNVENLTLTGVLAINGAGNDLNNKLTGNSAANQLNGGIGNDTLDGKAGADNMIGGLGNDNYIVDNAGDIVTENLNEGTDKISSSITRTLPANVENLTLTGVSAVNGNGNGLANSLIGNSAANQLNGGGNNDTLDGGTGNNTLTGGGGQDTFKFTSAGHIDAITDFVVVDDTIQLENAVFAALTTTGSLAAGQFRIGTLASDANDFIIYNNVTGALLYDADANGAGLATQIATVGVGLAMTNADFVVI
ncbi:calcium-binding protein, partial [Nitrosomonas sp.]|uniref:calcium-binding protein n=1 Tax=Nitrosomonas sp. TaxID=42353 RepID=UPI0025F311C2